MEKVTPKVLLNIVRPQASEDQPNCLRSVEPFTPEVLPITGKSRWSRIAKFSPVSRETFRKLLKERRAPQPERIGIRCTFYDNQELHRWLADPINYRAEL